MSLQELERDADLRIKIASLKENGTWEHDASDEYEPLFAATPAGWRSTEVAGGIQTRLEGPRRAWQLSHEGSQLVAVEHETGAEFLISLAAGTVTSVASAAIIDFSKWAWRRWKELRASKLLPPSLVLEGVVERAPDGRPLVTARQELLGPLEADAVGESVGEFLQRRLRIHQDQTTKCRLGKLVVVTVTLAAFEIIAIVLLLLIGPDPNQPVILYGLETGLSTPWTLAVLGGILGGTTRALYAFLVQARAFEYKHRTGHPSPRKSVTATGNTVEDDFDLMFVWYLYLLKPLIGGAMGFLFALLLQFGLVPFLSNDGQDSQAFGIVLASALAGIFAEDAMRALRGLFPRQ